MGRRALWGTGAHSSHTPADSPCLPRLREAPPARRAGVVGHQPAPGACIVEAVAARQGQHGPATAGGGQGGQAGRVGEVGQAYVAFGTGRCGGGYLMVWGWVWRRRTGVSAGCMVFGVVAKLGRAFRRGGGPTGARGRPLPPRRGCISSPSPNPTPNHQRADDADSRARVCEATPRAPSAGGPSTLVASRAARAPVHVCGAMVQCGMEPVHSGHPHGRAM